MRAAILSATLLFSAPAQACEVALMLAVDVSGSVSPAEYRIQMDGLAAALTDRGIASALVEGQSTLALMQWTGSGRQRIVIGWTQMTDAAAVARFADDVVLAPRVWRNFSTAIGEALALAISAFDDVPDCARRVIDVSGDGPNNEGRLPQALRGVLSEADITVNALVIEENIQGLTRYFEQEVITGQGAFAITANRFADYPAQITRKLYRELTQAVSLLDVAE